MRRVGVTRRWCTSLVSVLVLAVFAVAPAGASALSQRGHVFGFAFGSKGKGDGEFLDPAGVAVSDATGDVYVADRKGKRVEQFRPVYSGEGVLDGMEYVRSVTVSAPSAVAVDNSTEGLDPSRDDVYVVGGKTGNAIYKFSSEGIAVAKPLKGTDAKGVAKNGDEKPVKEKLEAIEGIAISSSGELLVYQEDGAIHAFNDAEINESISTTHAGFTSKGMPGFAVDAEGDLYTGIEGAGKPVVAELEGATGKVLVPDVDGEGTSAVAVNPLDVPGNDVDERDDVYIAAVGSGEGMQRTTVAELGPEGLLIQRFGAPGLREGDAVAVDADTGAVYVSDAVSGNVDVFELEPTGPPTVEGLTPASATPPTADARQLQAQVDPNGADTHYYFEYGASSCAASPSACTKSPPVDLGGGFGDRQVMLSLASLPLGVYYYRVVAENEFGVTDSAEASFAILEMSSGLPDNRAWEMVTPAEKQGGAVEALTIEGGLILASEDGNELTYVTEGALLGEAQGNRSPEMQQVLAVRGTSGWVSKDIATPHTTPQGAAVGIAPEYKFFSSDLSLALVQPWGTHALSEPPLAEGAVQRTMYLRDDATGSYLPLVTEANVWPGVAFGGALSFAGATPDLSHIVFHSNVALAGPASAPGLYEWSAGNLQFVSVLPGGAAAVEPDLGFGHITAGAISQDGTRVIFTTAGSGGLGHLYMRDSATGETVQLDAAQGVNEPVEPAAQFQAASSDGSRVFFTDDQRLTAESTAEPAHERADLYECEVLVERGRLSCRLKDLTVDGDEGAAVQGLVLGAGQDGSSVYLVAHGVLAAVENGNGEAARAGGENLYALRELDGAWRTTFVAELSSQDAPEWEGGTDSNSAYLTARVSPNGRYLAFMSAASLTGYDNVDQTGGVPDEEVYLYDSDTSRLTCVSCDPSQAPPAGVLDTPDSGEGLGLLVDRRGAWTGHWLAGSIPGWTSESLTSALLQSRYLSNEGRLLFDSADPLVPGITAPTRQEEINGAMRTVGVENVYEYEPSGLGTCDGPAGCVSLISSGSSQQESAFLEATPSGDDVFFLTAAQLSPRDTDTEFDIYDARVCTPSSPCLPPPPASSHYCNAAEACRVATSSAPSAGEASGSAAFSGAGNITPKAGTLPEKQAELPKPKPLTRAQKLARALAACRRQHPHSRKRRQACEARERNRYHPSKQAAKR